MIFTPHFSLLVLSILFLMTDSLLAFKSSMLFGFGIYIITFLKLIYKDGRPFWIDDDVKAYYCAFDFSGPSYHMFILTFLYPYLAILYWMKYSTTVYAKTVILFFIFVAVFAVWTCVGGLYLGIVYLYQNFIGTLYGIIFLVLCLNFDTEIHRLCESTGFIVQSSRKYKFYLFFLCIGLFILAVIYYNAELENWIMPQFWVVYASNEERCRKDLMRYSNNKLGLSQTFFYSSIVFFLAGMAFGSSYSLVYVDCLDWAHTHFAKRICRALLGGGIAFALFFLFQIIPAHDNPTKYFFLFLLPASIISFFIYGIWPVICELMICTSSTP